MADDLEQNVVTDEETQNVVLEDDEPIREFVLKVNGTFFPNVKKGSYSLAPITEYNEYKCEDGSSTVEEVNTGFFEGTVNYKALLQADVYALYQKLTLVSDIAILDPTSENRVYYNMKCLIDNKKLPYVYNDEDISVWGMSFHFRQIKAGSFDNEITSEEVETNAPV